MTFPYPHRTLAEADYDEWSRRPRELRCMTMRQWFAERAMPQRIMRDWWPKACDATQNVK